MYRTSFMAWCLLSFRGASQVLAYLVKRQKTDVSSTVPRQSKSPLSKEVCGGHLDRLPFLREVWNQGSTKFSVPDSYQLKEGQGGGRLIKIGGVLVHPFDTYKIWVGYKYKTICALHRRGSFFLKKPSIIWSFNKFITDGNFIFCVKSFS